MDALTWAKTLGGIGAGLGAVIPIAHRYAIRPISRGVKGLKDMHEKVQSMDTALKPNKGSSMFDKVETLARDVSAMKEQQHKNGAQIQSIDERTADTNETLKLQIGRNNQVFDLMQSPLFEMDGEGHMTRVNAKFEREFGVTNTDMLGEGWLASLDMVERDPVMREIKSASMGRRAFRAIVTFESGRRAIKAVMMGQPTVDGQAVLAFQGALEVLSVTEAKA